MRVFIAVLVLIFSFQSFTKADDIRDFEIDGISIGDSLFKFFNEDEILNAIKTIYPGSDKFFDVHLKLPSENYDQITITLKKNDKNYIIYTLAGDIYFTDEEDKCLVKKDQITNDFLETMPNLKKEDYKHVYKTVDDGKSYSHVSAFKLDDGSQIRVWCNFFTKETLNKKSFFNGLSVELTTKEQLEWLDNEAYK